MLRRSTPESLLLLTKLYGERVLEERQYSRGARTLGSEVAPWVWAPAAVEINVLVGFSKKQTLAVRTKYFFGRSSKETPIKESERQGTEMINGGAYQTSYHCGQLLLNSTGGLREPLWNMRLRILLLDGQGTWGIDIPTLIVIGWRLFPGINSLVLLFTSLAFRY